eukprot:CAMPEP_0196654526 /NCGR_PEP_ID=MMETSP1086-20130531/4244_1 /TAXON_ID=77921 /ORGANISM="Cyanoptyche  gloeocystis , Strain SAG4.97" /LENGTH=57 /DNA_ID=CAMNT_0041986347 /DNA_START=698 /DNA_END=871 /DNA_ORIENTATION=+
MTTRSRLAADHQAKSQTQVHMPQKQGQGQGQALANLTLDPLPECTAQQQKFYGWHLG